jgi:hypothetical protein
MYKALKANEHEMTKKTSEEDKKSIDAEFKIVP